jgi:hypothetical membrane protein
MLAAAGTVAPLWFTVLVIAQGLQPDYDHVALPISALAAWPLGWIQNLNFLVYGALVIGFAAGLHLALHPTAGGATGPALLAIAGAGAIVAGIFPWIEDGGVLVEPAGHIAGALVHFLSAPAGLIVISRRMLRDPRWRSAAPYTLATGLVMLALFLVFALFGLPEHALLHPWAGVVQRVIVGVWFACTIVLAVRMRRIVQAAPVLTNIREGVDRLRTPAAR